MKSSSFLASPQAFITPILGLFALALSACQPVTLTDSGLQTSLSTPSGQPAKTPSATIQAETSSTEELAGSTPKVLPKDTTEENLTGEAAIETANLASLPAIELPAEPPKITTINPQELLGKTLEDITNQLGEADFKRSEGQIGIWQYRQANCVVDFFFQMTDTSTNLSQKTAIALDIRKRIISQPLDEVRCQKELYQRQMKG
ncbi:hypothetical protein OAT45_00215 [Alphaproteobacteria bacterium]|nr:hypothetical protein [Alphaproteobacteria bacterium]